MGLQTGRRHSLHLLFDIVLLLRLFTLKTGVAACDDCWSERGGLDVETEHCAILIHTALL